MEIAIMLEGQMGLNWDRLEKVAGVVESSGFSGLFRSDHFTNPNPPDHDSLELWVSLTWMAMKTHRVHFGQLVSPVSFRDPVMTARQASHVDDLSGGRLMLGLGAGWQQREHDVFGYELGDVSTRMSRLQEALEIVSRLLKTDQPVSFEGRFFRVRDAFIKPRPAREGGPPLVIGGNGQKRTLPLAAKYGDVWNGSSLTPDQFAAKARILDELCERNGRDPSLVKKTLMAGVFYGADSSSLEAKFVPFRKNPAHKDSSTEELANLLREHGALAGTGPEIRDRLNQLADAGVQEVMLQWLDLDDVDGLAALGEHVL